ncbi:MAG: ATP-binding cassette domain-containing protein [Bacteroidia bacterium]|jgi:polar amino acid transport system ATP-binding protein/putative ABC transport system ATP-binding protein|nr:ATP-binding cassette domain-containing protein [Bacteroidia bacterium]
MININQITLSFQDKTILDNFSAQIRRGEHVCFSGSSGRGKSSLLKIIQAYLIPAKGEISIDGLTLNRLQVKNIRNKMAYVPQNIHLPVKNGTELLEMLAKSQLSEKAEIFCEKLGLPREMLSRSFDEMSGGQKQRIVIAVCLSLEREILLLDEPTASLDDEAIDALIECIKGLENTTVVSASHNSKWLNAAGRVISI